MTEEQQQESSERYVATNKRLLASLEENYCSCTEDYLKRKKQLLQEIATEQRNIKRREEAWQI